MKTSYERALLVVNPIRPSSRQTAARQFGDFPIPVKKIYTHANARATHDEIRKVRRPGDVLFSCGGDGTTHLIGNLIMQDDELRAMPFVPVRGGNANDVARSLNGRRSAAHILRHGREVTLHPLARTVRSPQREAELRYAFGYFSVGDTAKSTHMLDTMPKGSFKVINEVVTALRGLSTHPAFTMTPSDGEARTVGGILALRGDRIAKYGRPNARHDSPFFEFAVTEPTGLAGSIGNLLLMQQSILPSTMTDWEEFVVETDDDSPLYSQCDGEVAMIESGSVVGVGIAEDSYVTLATRL